MNYKVRQTTYYVIKHNYVECDVLSMQQFKYDSLLHILGTKTREITFKVHLNPVHSFMYYLAIAYIHM